MNDSGVLQYLFLFLFSHKPTVCLCQTFLPLNLISGSSVCACRLLRSRSGSQDELLLLGILLSSSSVLISGLDEASLSNWTLELLCSVSSDGSRTH